MSKSKPPRIPGTGSGLPPRLVPPSRREIENHYGEGVAATFTLTEGRDQREPLSYLVQEQHATRDEASRWHTLAVYNGKAHAEATVARWESAGPTMVGMVNTETGEMQEVAEQPVKLQRIVTLDELLIEGPVAVWWAMYDLVSSDHDWHLTAHVAFDQYAAIVDHMDKQAGDA